jgi:hypothetical protein
MNANDLLPIQILLKKEFKKFNKGVNAAYDSKCQLNSLD